MIIMINLILLTMMITTKNNQIYVSNKIINLTENKRVMGRRFRSIDLWTETVDRETEKNARHNMIKLFYFRRQSSL